MYNILSSRLKNSGFKAYFSLGNILLRKGKLPDSLASYQRAFKPIFSNKYKRNWSLGCYPESQFIVNRKYNFIYCPIGKVASSSIKRVIVQLSDLENKEEIVNLPKGFIHAYVEHSLTLGANYSHEEAIEIVNDARYFKFVIVRNPWGRLASGYLNRFVWRKRNLIKQSLIPPKYIKDVIDNIYSKKGLESDYQRGISFREFINYLSVTENEKLDGHWKPQYLHLGNTKFDFIGKLENLDRDFKYIQEKLNIEHDLPWKNKTKRNNNSDELLENNSDRHYCDYYPSELRKLKRYPKTEEIYTSDLIELVNERYKKDIEMFDYNFFSLNN